MLVCNTRLKIYSHSQIPVFTTIVKESKNFRATSVNFLAKHEKMKKLLNSRTHLKCN